METGSQRQLLEQGGETVMNQGGEVKEKKMRNTVY